MLFAKMYDIFAEQIHVVAESVCSANQCKVEYLKMPKVGDVVRPVWNDEKLSEVAEKALENILPGARVTESVWMAAEPFGWYQKYVPDVFAFVGVKNEELGSGAVHHNAKFDIDENALIHGVALTVQFASDFMNEE